MIELLRNFFTKWLETHSSFYCIFQIFFKKFKFLKFKNPKFKKFRNYEPVPKGQSQSGKSTSQGAFKIILQKSSFYQSYREKAAFLFLSKIK
jgi:hypothetical protein